MEQTQHETNGQGDSSGTAETDELFGVLANANRRFVLQHLSDRANDPTLEQLAAAVAEWNKNLTREDARIALHHAHLPKLEAVGIVTCDETISLTDEAVESLNLVEQV